MASRSARTAAGACWIGPKGWPAMSRVQWVAVAVRRRSAVRSHSGMEPALSMTTATFGPSRSERPVASAAACMACAIGRGSASSCGSRPARGEISIGRPVSISMMASTASTKGAAVCGRRPRTCRLPRAVTSIWPLPNWWVSAAMRISWSGLRMRSTGRRRTNKPSPVSIGAARVGQAPRRWAGGGAAFCDGGANWTGFTSGSGKISVTILIRSVTGHKAILGSYCSRLRSR